MSYLSARPGDFGVVALTGPRPAAIRWLTGSWADHAFVVGEHGMIIEAWMGGVRTRPLADYAACRMVFSREDLADEQRGAIVRAAEAMLGRGYDLLAIAAFALRLGIGLNVDPIVTRIPRERVFCSQLVVLAGRAAGLDRARGVPLHRVSPGVLAALLERDTVA